MNFQPQLLFSSKFFSLQALIISGQVRFIAMRSFRQRISQMWNEIQLGTQSAFAF